MLFYFSIDVKYYSKKDEDFKKIKVSDEITPEDNTTMELKKYFSLSTKSLHLPFVTHTCTGNASKDMSVGLNYDKDTDSYFAMVRYRIIMVSSYC